MQAIYLRNKSIIHFTIPSYAQRSKHRSYKINKQVIGTARWRHQMETFSALLAICAGNLPVIGEFPAQRPVTRSFDVFFDLGLDKRLSQQSPGWWFETPSRPLWCHCNGVTKLTATPPCSLTNAHITCTHTHTPTIYFMSQNYDFSFTNKYK